MSIRNIGLFFAAGIMALLTGCEEEGANFKQYVYEAPVIESLSPQSGYVGTQVTILGDKFGDRKEAVKVFFGGAPTEADDILSCKDDCIVVNVPEGAVSGEVSVQLWKNKVVAGNYKVIPLPTVTSAVSNNTNFGEDVAVSGDIVTIAGTGFGTNQDKVTVDFNGTPAEILTMKDTEIKVLVPEGYQSGTVNVIVNGIALEARKFLNPNAKGDITFVYFTNYKQPFTVSDEMTSDMKGTKLAWALPAGWTVNTEARSVMNEGATARCGGLNFNTSAGELILQAGWGAIAFANGKMYQTSSVELPAGNYRLTLHLNSYEVKGNPMYFTAVKGEIMPDITAMPGAANVLNSWKFEGNGQLVESIEFILAESSKITIGFVGSLSGDVYFRASEVKLELL